MDSTPRRQPQARRPGRRGVQRRLWLHALLALVFLAVGVPGGHAMAGVDSPAHATAMADCEGCAGLADASAACTASLSQLPAALVQAVLVPVTGGVAAPDPLPESGYRSPDLDGPRHPPRAA